MNRLHSTVLAGGLLLAPVLLTVHEVARLRVDDLYVENESDPLADASSHLAAVASHQALWHAVTVLEIVFAATWAVSMLAIVLVVAGPRPVLAVLTGVLGLVATLGAAMHTAFYFGALDQLAAVPDRDLAVHSLAATDPGLAVVVGVVMFLLGSLLAVVVGGFALWRARALPWWGVAGLVAWVAYVALGPEQPVFAYANLALLLPFAAAARALRARDSAPAASPVPVAA